MKHKYHILPSAQEEFTLAREWYQQQLVRGLSNRFAQAVKICILKIRSNPYAHAIRYKNVRIAHTDKFPYAIHFYLDNNVIVITSIIFQGRNPLIARRRVE